MDLYAAGAEDISVGEVLGGQVANGQSAKDLGLSPISRPPMASPQSFQGKLVWRLKFKGSGHVGAGCGNQIQLLVNDAPLSVDN